MNLLYEASWHTYEEWGGVEIYEDGAGLLYVREGGYSVYGNPHDPEWGELYEITMQDAVGLIDEWAAIEKEYEAYFR